MNLKVMLIGLGGLGRAVLEFMAREPAVGAILVASRDASRGPARANLTRLGAVAHGAAPSIRFLPLDLHDRAQVTATVEREQPDIILSTATLQTWWLAGLLPPEADELRAVRFGAWLPVHLTLTQKLMEALREARFAGVVLTAPFPDVVNAVLACQGLAPTCGVGNVDEVAAKVRWLAAERLSAAPRSLRVTLVAHHALLSAAFRGDSGDPPPCFLRVELEGEDVTERAGGRDLIFAPYPISAGPSINFFTAGSIVRLVRALAADEDTRLHAPAPQGLPGGYPILARRGSIRPAPIDGLTLAEAVAINERSHPFDGIERIEADGTVVFSAQDSAALRRTLGYDCVRLRPAESEGRARELMARFREYARRLGVDLDRAAGNLD